MNESQIADIWMLFKEYLDKKVMDIVAERYVSMLVDHDVSEKQLENAIGFDDILDDAISEELGTELDEYDGD
jgi:hypothetical protein